MEGEKGIKGGGVRKGAEEGSTGKKKIEGGEDRRVEEERLGTGKEEN